MHVLTRAPAPRIQGPEPASSTTRTTSSSLDIFFARSTHHSRPAKSIPSSASTAPSKPSPDEPIPSYTTTPTKLAATSRATTVPSPPPRASSTCPPSPSCSAAPQPTRSHWCHPTTTPDAAADCTSTRPARRYSTYASCRCTDTDTADRRSCIQTCVDRRSSRAHTKRPSAERPPAERPPAERPPAERPSAGRTSTWIRGLASTERQDSKARRHRAKWRALVRHVQRLHSKHPATTWTANHAPTCSICCSNPTVRFASSRWSKCASGLASTATPRNLTRSCS
jgi:hypothetical protein